MISSRAALFCLLASIGSVAAFHADEKGQATKTSGFVVKEHEGEILPRDDAGGNTQIIKIAPEHSAALGVATSRFKGAKARITVHAHDYDDEAFFVHRGAGTFILGDRRIPISAGDIVFIPKGEWHGFENGAADTLLVWAISSSKYLEIHRMFFSGKPPPPPSEGEAILRRYGFREGPPEKKQ
jgi:mannose-6-phosphate isomerase-like protein (cupin superfamily)